MKLNREKFELAKARACMGTKDIVAAGVSKGTLCTAMNPNKETRPETIGKIAKILAVDVTEIID